MPTALVTGATGCVGSNLCAALRSSGWTVRTYSRSPLPSPLAFTGDITDEQSLVAAARGCDTVFHTAALVSFSRNIRNEQHRVNVLGTRAVVKACLSTGVPRLVHTSSVAAIGNAPQGESADETSPLDRTRLYGYKESKVLAEDEIFRGVDAGLNAVIVNPSVIIGEGDRYFHGGELLRSIRNGLIPGYVNGGMNLVAVRDVVRGMLLAIDRGKAGERYILAGANLRHREIFTRTAELVNGMPPLGEIPPVAINVAGRIVESFCRMIHLEPPFTADLADLAGRTMWYSNAKAKRELGFETMGFDEMILRAYRWYREKGLL
jgi:dihydroflavonol-4-reductase